MITVEVSSNTADQPVDSFIDNTVRRVRKPNNEAGTLWLIVNVNRESYLVVEVEGEEYTALALEPKPQSFRLAELLKKPERSSPFAGLLKPLISRSTPKAVRTPDKFTVRIHADSPDGPRIGTFDFELMNEADYDSAYDAYAGQCTGRVRATCFTTDARSLDTAHDCWNCKQPLAAGECCPKCGCEQVDD